MKKMVTVLLCLMFLLVLTVPAAAVEEQIEGIAAVVSVNAVADKIEIDGKMEDGEWGDPIYVTTPQQLHTKKNDGWDYGVFYQTSAEPIVELYVTNDADSLYVACKLIGAAYDAGAQTSAQAYDHAHFGFTVASYIEGDPSDAPYAQYVFAIVNGCQWSDCGSQGVTGVTLKQENYNISYDFAARTYVYEVRLPLSYTPVDAVMNRNAVMSFQVDDAHGMSYPLLVKLRSTQEMVKPEFVPTEEEQAAAERLTQSGIIAYDSVADTDMSARMLMTTAIIVAAIALAVLIFTLIVLLNRRRRSFIKKEK